MPSDPHPALYQKLRDHNLEVKNALAANDPETLMNLAEEHRRIVGRIKSGTDSKDSSMREMIKTTAKELESVLKMIREEQNHVIGKMRAIGNKNRLKQAYRQ